MTRFTAHYTLPGRADNPPLYTATFDAPDIYLAVEFARNRKAHPNHDVIRVEVVPCAQCGERPASVGPVWWPGESEWWCSTCWDYEHPEEET